MSDEHDLLAVDIGGTHARFAIADLSAGQIRLGETTTLATSDYRGLDAASVAFAARQPRPLPRAAAIAVACPVDGDILTLTNNAWTIDRRRVASSLGVDRCLLLNDFEAVAHAVAAASPDHLRHVAGPDVPLPAQGVVSVVGPGTGLGVAQVIRRDEAVHVVATEAGHMGFAPTSPFEDALLARLRARHGRVSVERVVSGPGLRAIVEASGGSGVDDDAALWTRALEGSDAPTLAALAAFCRCLGEVAGDLALAHGADAVVIGGGIGLRLADRLAASPFAAGFCNKGRFGDRMRALPVKVITHPQPGLFGAAAAFAREHAGETRT